MTYTKLHSVDRASGQLDSQLLSSQTSGSFTFSTLSNLGTQSWQAATGDQFIVTIEDEQILLETLTESAGTATATIAALGRGYNGTTAATHPSTTLVNAHVTKAHLDRIQTHLAKLDEAGLINYTEYTPTITSASVHSVAGVDLTGVFTVGRPYLFKVAGTWRRAVVRSSSFSVNTTINIDGDTLPASGTVTDAGFEYSISTRAPLDLTLIKNMTAEPVNNPPAGYRWLYVANGILVSKDSAGLVVPITKIRAAVSSAAGALATNWKTAQIYDITLTENVTALTHSNGVDGQEYILRIKQDAVTPRTVILGTGGGTRYSETTAGYSVSTTLGSVDVLRFVYSAADTTYYLVSTQKGFAASPAQAITNIPTYISGGFVQSHTTPESLNKVIFDPSGDNMYTAHKTSATTMIITRFVKDASTGMYYANGETVTYSSLNSTEWRGSIYATASFVYIVGMRSGSQEIRVVRYGKDLTGINTLTVPSGATSYVYDQVCGDDTQFFVFRTTTQVVKYTISGTTVTANGTFTMTESDVQGCFFNGTDIIYTSTSSSRLRRMSIAGTILAGINAVFANRGPVIGLGVRQDTTLWVMEYVGTVVFGTALTRP